MLPVDHARTICRSLAKFMAAVALSLTGAGSWGTLRYIAAFSRFVGLHIARNSGREGGHGSPLVTHASSPRRICSEPNVISAAVHNSSGDEPYWLAHLCPYRLAMRCQNVSATLALEPFLTGSLDPLDSR